MNTLNILYEHVLNSRMIWLRIRWSISFKKFFDSINNIWGPIFFQMNFTNIETYLFICPHKYLAFSNTKFNVSSFLTIYIKLIIGSRIFNLQINNFQGLILNENDQKKFEYYTYQSNQECFSHNHRKILNKCFSYSLNSTSEIRILK